jgi:nucleotide-binding universal stress UspA family protein
MEMYDNDNNNNQEPPLRKILVPLDGSEWSFRAARYAIKIATMAKAEIVCLHAVSNPPYTVYAHADELVPRYIEEARNEAQKWCDDLKVIAEKAGLTRLTAETIVNALSVADAITRYAEENYVDLIVMGTKGRTGLKKVLLGGVASPVISHAKCPVLVVR